MRTSKPLRRESEFSRWALRRRRRSARNSCLLSNGWAVSGTLRLPATERSSISRAGAGRKGTRASLRSASDPESRSTARLEHCAYRLVDILQEHEIDFFLRFRRDFLKVLTVARRPHHAADRGARFHERQPGLRGLLHHITELTGENQFSAARRAARLDEQDVAADRRPRESRSNARHGRAQRHLVLELRRS